MYELFLLGKLFGRPWYGYEFRRVLGAFVGPARRVSWGTIYPLFRRLQSQRLIREVAAGASDGGPERRCYAITAAGRKQFQRLMAEDQESNTDCRENFRAKLGNFSRIDRETQREVVRSHFRRINAILDHTTEQLGIVQRVAEMGEEERAMILKAIDHERSLAAAEIEWIRAEMASLL